MLTALLLAVAVAGVAVAFVWGDQIQQGVAALTRRAPADGSASGPFQTSTSSPELDGTDPVTSVTVAPLAGPAPPATGPRPSPVASAPEVRPSAAALAKSAALSLGTAPRPTRALSPGIVVFRSSLDLEVYHEGQRIGTTQAGGLTLPPGTVDLVLVSARHEFRQARSVTVPSGQTTSMTVALPNGRLSVNADPWAQVLIDNRLVGTTPLANLPVRIGSHEVVWRHPTLGERRQVVLVKARTPTRAGVDFRR